MQALFNSADGQRNDQQQSAEHEEPMLQADEFREWQRSAHYARQQFVSAAENDNREEAENLELRLRAFKPSEPGDLAEVRAIDGDGHQPRQQKGDGAEFDVAERSALAGSVRAANRFNKNYRDRDERNDHQRGRVGTQGRIPAGTGAPCGMPSQVPNKIKVQNANCA